MIWNPLRTLAGRLVLVTLLAVLISNLIAFALFANERGASIRRAYESAIADRVAFTYRRLAAAAPERREAITRSLRDFGIRYTLDAQPTVAANVPIGAAQRLALMLSERLDAPEVRVSARLARGHPDHRRMHGWRYEDTRSRAPRSDDGDRPSHRFTEASISASLGEQWLNARVHLPGPRPAPWGVLVGGVVTLLVVGVGAALVSRQIGRPLAELADAARALGAGETSVTAPVHGPEDVRRASSAFNTMAERLGRQMNRQRQMLWALSHDLRTPITALKLRAELIGDEAERQRLLAPIAEMEHLTEQALALARAGASQEQRSIVDLAEIARTLCGELQDTGIDVGADAPAPVMAECRPSEIARAMRNLAENAARHGGGGMMRVRAAGDEAVIAVLDEGPGVPDDMRARLAELFFRADAARSDSAGVNGAGLGLAIAQAIADSHGGRLVLENRTPHGFSASLILPR